MAERLRLVSLRWPKPPAVLVDLAVTPQGSQLLRDTFAVKMGDVTQSLSASTSRWGGSRVVGERRQNAMLSVTLLILGDPTAASPKDSALRRIQNVLQSALMANNPELAIEWRPDGATYSTFWRLRGPASYALNYSWAKFTSGNYFPVDIAFPVAPTGEGAPYDICDDFSTDTITGGDWIKDAGTGTLFVNGGALAPSQIAGTAMRYRHARGYPYGDVEVLAKITTGTTLTNGLWGVYLAADTTGADTKLMLELTPTGYSLVKWVAGTRTSLSGPTAITVTANTTYYFLLRRAGNVLYWRLATTTNWSEWVVETNTYQLAPADLRLAGPGHVGISITAADVAERYDDFIARPFVYRGIQSPEQVQLNGPIVGEAPAFADLEVTPVVGVSTNPPIFGMVAWAQRAKVQNMIGTGNLTTVRPAGTPTYGWSVAAVAGVIGAATSYARGTITTPFYGLTSLQITCPATADTGGNYKIPRRFKRGRVYAALARLAASSGTPGARIKLGVSGDLSTGATTTMSATQVPVSTVWQPTADYDGAYLTLGNVAAVAAPLEATGIVVVEVPAITLSAALTNSQTTITPYYIATEISGLNPDGSVSEPFPIMIDQELMLVTQATAGVWTVLRGIESSVKAVHSQDAYVILLPPARPQLEGKGAEEIFSVIEGENYAADRQLATLVASSNYRSGQYASLNPGQFLDYYVDPSSIPPDDFSQGEALVEVWGRLLFDPAGTLLYVQISANSSETYDPTVALASTAGTQRFPLEPACNPLRVNIVPTSGTGGVLMPLFLRLGTLSMRSDPARPQRWKLRVFADALGGGSVGVGWGLDYLIVVPIRSRAATPTGKSSGDTTYPTFLPPGTTALAVTKILRADGSGALRVPRIGTYSQPDAFPDSGLGHEIELPNADCDMLVKLSNFVPNDTIAVPASEMFTAQPFWTTAMHVAVTPRLVALRGA